MMMAVASIMIATGQFYWKLAAGEIGVWLIVGFVLYGFGAVFMITALKHGELSILHPVMGVSYIVAALLAVFFLHESFSTMQATGIVAIILGVILLGAAQGNDD